MYGRPIPRTSVREFMLLAVKRPEQEPQPGQHLSATHSSCSSSMSPLLKEPTLSMTLLKSRMSPSRFPVRIGPPDTITEGMFRRAAAIIMPGTILSQLGMRTRPSRAWPFAMASMESQMSSRLASGYFMPSCPMAMPSQMPIAGNSTGVPPARMMPLLTACATRSRSRCPGISSFCALTTPMRGRSISSFTYPIP